MSGRPFKIYRIICTLTGKALIAGSDSGPWHRDKSRAWHERGLWGSRGCFWKTEATIKKHLLNLCDDWWLADVRSSSVWCEHRRTTKNPDLSRLEHLKIEVTTITDYSISEIPARDFLGVLEPAE